MQYRAADMSHSMIRITTWNCRSGSVHARIAEAAELETDLLFLQECRPEPALSFAGDVLQQTVTSAKGLALASPNGRFSLSRLSRPGAPTSSIAAIADGPVRFLLLGSWTHPPAYRAEVDQLVAAYADVSATMPTVLLGDLNTGPALGNPVIRGGALFQRLEALGLVSAYHVHHGVNHGHETHATYYHSSSGNTPWHIDYCFVPSAWRERLRSVDVGGEDTWAGRSDHRPLTVVLSYP